jgi:hypothetical protein
MLIIWPRLANLYENVMGFVKNIIKIVFVLTCTIDIKINQISSSYPDTIISKSMKIYKNLDDENITFNIKCVRNSLSRKIFFPYEW